MVFIHFFVQILLACLAFNLAVWAFSTDQFVITHLVMSLNQGVITLIHFFNQWLRELAAIAIVFAFKIELKTIDHMVHLRQVLMNPFFILLFFERSAAIGTERMRFENFNLTIFAENCLTTFVAAYFGRTRKQMAAETRELGNNHSIQFLLIAIFRKDDFVKSKKIILR